MSASWFADDALARGIDFHHRSGFSGRRLLPQIVGGGAALADFDDDGDLDALLVQSGNIGQPAAAAGRFASRLFLNRGQGRFEAAADAFAGVASAGYGMGAATGDYDNDGDIDVYLTNLGPNLLLRNDGHAHFTDVAAAAGVAEPGWGTAATFLDLDAVGDLDLFLVNYIDWSLATERDCYHGGAATYCLPTHYAAPATDHLYRNNGDGTFTDISSDAGLKPGDGNGLGVVGADFDNDGRLDLFVANDTMVNQLWMNRGNLRFVDEAMQRGVALDENGIAKAGMGVAAGDVDDDGDVDLLVANLGGQSDSYFRNEGSHFVDATSAVGLGAVSRRHTRFGIVLADLDNDSRLDLYEANGRVDSVAVGDGDVFAEPNLLFRGTSAGRFEEVQPAGGTALPLVHTSRAVASGDVDDDGGIDLLVVNRDAVPYLLMNRVAARGNWLRCRVLTRAGRDDLGASVSARVGSRRLRREVQAAGGYLSGNDPRVSFGLGGAAAAEDVSVRFSNGAVERFGTFAAGRTVELREGAGGADGAH